MTKDPYKYFRVEARELLEGLTQGVLEIEQGGAGPDRVAGLLRLAHTLKGASRVVKQPLIAELVHSMESVLAPHRDGQNPVPEESIGELLRLADGIASGLAALETPRERGVAAAARPASEEPFETVRVEVEEVNAVLDNLSEGSVRLTAIRQEAEGLKRARRLAHLMIEQVNSRATPADGLISPKLRGLVEDLSTSLERLDRGLVTNIEQAERELAQARERADHLRLLTAGTIFPSLARAARNAAQTLGKRVELDPSGGDIRLDAHVLMVLRDALLHLVSNAVAHGIESEEVRLAAGKPAVARVELRVERRGGSVAFICRDDGAGIDVEAIRRAAVRRGAISADRAQNLDLKDAIELILGGGVSTTGTVTEVSGRGIGLDVVRAAAARLKGNLTIGSVPGRGTTVEVCVPVSLTSVAVLNVESAGLVTAIPLDAVRRTLLVDGPDLVRSGRQESIAYESRMIPFFPLSQALGLQNGTAGRRERWPTVLVAFGPALVAVGVDRLLGVGTVLVRMLPTVAAADPVVAGASLDAEGNPRLVLDAAGLAAAGDRTQSPAPTLAGARRPILVIDDSLTTRMLEQSILESAGHVVELATSAEEALEKAAVRSYGLFLVDVEMPGMDGFEFVARTRADAVLRDVPAILMTSRNSVEDRQRGKEAGACAYFVKSEFDQSNLLQTIRQMVTQA
ncbi:MAG TPA: response regulator [Bryobacteraceae bacterium]|nr:response regulator [Bryobacteraceae bacterium]